MPFQKIAIAGAAGFLGNSILKHLLTIPSVSQITILSRSTSSTFLSSPILTVVSLPSYNDIAALTAALQSHDLLISALSRIGSDAADASLVSAAIAAGVKRYMPSEYTVDCMHPHSIAVAGSTVLAGKVASAKHIQQLAEKGEIEYTTFVTGAFLNWWFEKPNPVIVAKEKKITLLDGGEKKMTGSTTDFIARCIGAVVTMPEDLTKNRRIRIAETEYTGNALLTTFEEVTGENWTVIEKSTDVFLAEAEQARKNGNWAGFYYGNILKLNFDGEGAGYFEEGMEWMDGSVKRQSLKEMVERSFAQSK
jgi:uncharacterized protein YbjT (DUF2867 family)